jgi:hypothetical protein
MKMFKTMRKFIDNRKGSLIENIIYIIIIGALSYTFYMDKVNTPMSNNMDDFNSKIETWTNPESSETGGS